MAAFTDSRQYNSPDGCIQERIMPTVKVPNWIFQTTVISKALDLLDFTINSNDQNRHQAFFQLESDLALEESRDALCALIEALQILEANKNCMHCK